MNWRYFTLLTLLGCSLRLPAADAAGLELTGIVAVGDLRMACLKVQPGGQGLVVREGQTVAGITLSKLDAQTGEVLVTQGTNLVQLHLSCRAPEGSALAGARARLEQRRAALQAAEKQLVSAVTAPDDVVATTLNRHFPTAGIEPSAGTEKTAATGASSASPAVAASAVSAASPVDTTTGRQLLHIKTVDDPEGDRVRGLLGTQAFLVWDLAHADRWQQKPAQ